MAWNINDPKYSVSIKIQTPTGSNSTRTINYINLATVLEAEEPDKGYNMSQVGAFVELYRDFIQTANYVLQPGTRVLADYSLTND